MSDLLSGTGVVIRRASGLPAYQQLVDQLRFLVGAGRYPVGSYLPPMRVVAAESGLNLNTVNRAYRQLQRDGVIRSTPGKGALVCAAGEQAGIGSPAAAVAPEPVDAILAAAVERALSTGMPPAAIADRVASLVAELAAKVPPPPRVAVFAGRPWRSRDLAKRLAEALGREATPFDPEADEALPSLVVRPRFGGWSPAFATDVGEVPSLEVQVVPDRASIRALLDVEPGARLLALAADEPVARWIAETASAAAPASIRWLAVEDVSEAAPSADDTVVAESGLPGSERAAVIVAATFPGTVAADVTRALD